MRKLLILSIVAFFAFTSCKKASSSSITNNSNNDTTANNSNNDTTNNNPNIESLTVDIDNIPTTFDSIDLCNYYTGNIGNIITILGYKRNDTSKVKSNLGLQISAGQSILSGMYVDSVSNQNTTYSFLPSYTPPDFISWYSGDKVSIDRPEIQINFIKDSINGNSIYGTFEGRLICILYINSQPPDTTYHVLTNGKFNLKINYIQGSGI
jgi:hypothetical protein